MEPLLVHSCWDLQEVGVEATLCHLSFLPSSLAPYFPHPTLFHLPPGVGVEQWEHSTAPCPYLSKTHLMIIMLMTLLIIMLMIIIHNLIKAIPLIAKYSSKPIP